MKKSVFRVFLICSIIYSVCMNANSTEYTVQVGSYEKYAADVVSQVQPYGDVFHRKASDNLTRVQVGRFESKEAAKSTLDKLRTSGFSDAYVTSISRDAREQSISKNQSNKNTTEYLPEIGSSRGTPGSRISKASMTGLGKLTSEERSKAAYLDNQLRIFSDGKFYSVEQYRRLQE